MGSKTGKRPGKQPAGWVVYQPRVYQALQKGIGKIVSVVRPTFGPLHGTVILEHVGKVRPPEILDDGGLIARRIIELPDRDEDVGAMMVRHLMWRMHDRFGDASVTAAVIYQSIFDQSVRYILSGGNAMMLRRALDKGAQLVMDALDSATIPVTGAQQLAQLAKTLCGDEDMSRDLGEIIMALGRHGQLEIKPGQGRISNVEYKNGLTWRGEFFLRSMVQDKFKVRSELDHAHILVSNLLISNPYELAQWLAKISNAGVKKLLLLAREISPQCLAILEAARRNPETFDVIAIKLFETSEHWELQDLAILTGGLTIAREASCQLGSVEIDQLGQAEQVWAERNQFGILNGAAAPELVEQHYRQMLKAHENARDKRIIERLQTRIAGFTGKSAVYILGGSTRIEIDERVNLAKRVANTLRGAVTGGVLPGGGVALLECQQALDPMLASTDEDEKFAARIISRALQAPFELLVSNSGFHPSTVRARLQRRGNGFGYDVRSREIVKMLDAGILDMANAIKAAAYAGITGAALGLTVEVVVHPKKRKESYTTG